MVIFKKITDLKKYLSTKKQNKNEIGFIPTMGALHSGHLSLIENAREKNIVTVCSIFVNPTQFNNKNDFEKYPITIQSDLELLFNSSCDVVFLPAQDEIYPNMQAENVVQNINYYDTILEGAMRPNHFKGVRQVIARLIEIVEPTYLFLGQKDFQQCMVIKEFLENSKEVKNKIEIVVCPTIRESDGLAMSSRNQRLTAPQRIIAATIYQCLVSIVSKKDCTEFKIVQKECWDVLRNKGLEPEYIEIADSRDLKILSNYQKYTPTVALIAAKVGDIRLIDNMPFE